MPAVHSLHPEIKFGAAICEHHSTAALRHADHERTSASGGATFQAGGDNGSLVRTGSGGSTTAAAVSESKHGYHYDRAIEPSSLPHDKALPHEKDGLMQQQSASSSLDEDIGPLYTSHNSAGPFAPVLSIAKSAAAFCWYVLVETASLVKRTAVTIAGRDRPFAGTL